MQIKQKKKIIQTESKTIANLLEEYAIAAKSVAVAVNLEVIKQEKWDSYSLKENDVVECLTFMGGG